MRKDDPRLQFKQVAFVYKSRQSAAAARSGRVLCFGLSHVEFHL